LIPFEIIDVSDLSEAVAALDPDDPSIRPIAGGTALMLMMKAGMFQPSKLINLSAVGAKRSAIVAEADGSIRIGALASLRSLERSSAVRQALPVLGRALHTLSNVRVRNVATVGGALAHGDPHMDLPPVLIALGAKARILGPDGERTVPVEALVTGYYETQLAGNELISEVIVPPQGERRSVYLKVTTRAAHDWPALGVAVALSGHRDAVVAANLVISAVSGRALRMTEAADLLVGNAPDDKLLRDVAEACAAAVEPIDDAQGSVAYKRQLIRVYVRRALEQALAMTRERSS
jgi:carbon-monoxide dehydrogenase medium subunit